MVLVPFFDETEPVPPNNVECPCWECWRRSLQRAKCNKPARSHTPRLTWTQPIFECLRGFLWRCVPDNGHRAMATKAPAPGALLPWGWM